MVVLGVGAGETLKAGRVTAMRRVLIRTVVAVLAGMQCACGPGTRCSRSRTATRARCRFSASRKPGSRAWPRWSYPRRGRPAAEAERRAIVRAAVEPSSLRAADVVVELPPMRSAATTAAVFSDTGEPWVRTVAEGGRARWSVVDASRGVVREVRLPAGFKLEAVHGDLLYGTATTELGSPVVRVYRLRWTRRSIHRSARLPRHDPLDLPLPRLESWNTEPPIRSPQ